MYHFVTRWVIPAPIELVWEEIVDAQSWPAWTPGFKKVQLHGPAPVLEPDAVADCQVRGALPYTLRFSFQVVGFQPPRLLEIRAWGDLVGTGKWDLEPHPQGTAGTYYWDVGTSRPILNLAAKLPFAKAMMARNHDEVMKDAHRGLVARVQARRPAAGEG